MKPTPKPVPASNNSGGASNIKTVPSPDHFDLRSPKDLIKGVIAALSPKQAQTNTFSKRDEDSPKQLIELLSTGSHRSCSVSVLSRVRPLA
jgi:hypothetical protein